MCTRFRCSIIAFIMVHTTTRAIPMAISKLKHERSHKGIYRLIIIEKLCVCVRYKKCTRRAPAPVCVCVCVSRHCHCLYYGSQLQLTMGISTRLHEQTLPPSTTHFRAVEVHSVVQILLPMSIFAYLSQDAPTPGEVFA